VLDTAGEKLYSGELSKFKSSTLLLGETLTDAITLGEGATESPCVGDGDGGGDNVGDEVPVGVKLLVALLLAVREMESEMLFDCDCVADAESDAEFDADPVSDAETVPLGVPEGLNGEAESSSCCDAVLDIDAVIEADADGDGVVVPAAERLLESVSDGDADGLAEFDALSERDALRVPVPESDDETERPADGSNDGEGEREERGSSPCPRRTKPVVGPLTEPVRAFVETPPQKPCAEMESADTAGGSAYVQSLYVGPKPTETSPASAAYVCHPPTRSVSLRVKGVDEMLTDA
jgi:hypothetical protein